MGAATEASTLSMYLSDLSRRRILTAEAERDLAIRWRAGDREAGRRIIEGCLPCVTTIARARSLPGVPG